MKKKIILEIIDGVNKELTKNSDKWKQRYNGYLKKLEENEQALKELDSKFNNWKPLMLYSNLDELMNDVKFQFRFHGQRVAYISYNKDEDIILKPISETNNISSELELKKEFLWNSKEATEFREYFKNIENERKEVNMENKTEMISHFLKKFDEEKKTLKEIRPIKYYEICSFKMRTPLLVKNDPIDFERYEGQGGHIDIMAITRMEDNTSRLNVFEFENDKSAEDIIKKAVAYGVFMCHLLEDNEKWWNIINSKYGKPEVLEKNKKTIINVVALMPAPENGDGVAGFENQIYDVTANYSIEPYTLYYNKDIDEFTGFLPKVMMKRNS